VVRPHLLGEVPAEVGVERRPCPDRINAGHPDREEDLAVLGLLATQGYGNDSVRNGPFGPDV
jgi:hypothetical protein